MMTDGKAPSRRDALCAAAFIGALIDRSDGAAR